MLSRKSWNEKNANITQIWEFGEIARIYGRGNPKVYRIAGDGYMIQAIRYKHDRIPLFTYMTIGEG